MKTLNISLRSSSAVLQYLVYTVCVQKTAFNNPWSANSLRAHYTFYALYKTLCIVIVVRPRNTCITLSIRCFLLLYDVYIISTYNNFLI